MINGALLGLIVVTIMFAIYDFFYGYKAFQKTEAYGRYLGLSAFAGGVVTISYLFSICSDHYLYMSIASSIYFAGIDWMLVALCHFTYRFTDTHFTRSGGLIRKLIGGYAAFDTIIFLINVFREISVHYVFRDTIISHYVYQKEPLFIMHLIFTYILVGLVLYILFQKSRKTPLRYRNQYTINILALLFIVFVNAIFLYTSGESPLTLFDYSVLGYSVALFFMYWAAFEYKTNNLLKSLSMTIFENIDQGIVLFDYNDDLIMHNKQADELLPRIDLSDDMDCETFIDKCRMPVDIRDNLHKSFQTEIRGRQGNPLRCDFTRLNGSGHDTTGHLFVFTDASNDRDLLTGFQYWDEFKKYAAENPYEFDHPTTTVVFDIVGLSEVNRIFGREVGDQRIRNLVKSMEVCMPEGTYFLRGYEAHLGAVCCHATEEEIKGNIARILDANADTVMFGMSSTVDRIGSTLDAYEDLEGQNVIDALDKSVRALHVKKLLSPRSVKSQILTSLVRALQESDSDTEEHVQRTQRMGTELGKRIGLNDAQMADMKLLCLLHDIGKIGIPLEILNKPGRLTNEEWAVLKTHSEKGYQIAMSSAELKDIAKMILYHHERWDGLGYPEHLTGTSIPVLSRIISIVDSYDAMVNTRAYRRSMTSDEAKAEIKRCAGTQFDPGIANVFLDMLDDNPDIAEGQKVGGEEIRDFMSNLENVEETGHTIPVNYSRYLLNIDDMIIDVDDKFEEITGYNRNSVVGSMLQYDLIPPEDRADYIMQVNKQFAMSNTAYLLHEIVRKDGQRIWVTCHGKRFFDSAAKAFRSEIFIMRAGDNNMNKPRAV